MPTLYCPQCRTQHVLSGPEPDQPWTCPGCGAPFSALPTEIDVGRPLEMADFFPQPTIRIVDARRSTPPVQVNIVSAPAPHGNSLGLGSIILGVISLFLCWLPFLSLGLSAVGAVLGLIGLIASSTRRGSGIGFSLAGIAVCMVGMVLGAISTVTAWSAFDAIRELAAFEKAGQTESDSSRSPTPSAQPSDPQTGFPQTRGGATVESIRKKAQEEEQAARRKAQEEKAAREKAKEEARIKSRPENAASQVRLAKKMIEQGRKDVAKTLLKRVAEEYTETEAAIEAKSLLETLRE